MEVDCLGGRSSTRVTRSPISDLFLKSCSPFLSLQHSAIAFDIYTRRTFLYYEFQDGVQDREHNPVSHTGGEDLCSSWQRLLGNRSYTVKRCTSDQGISHLLTSVVLYLLFQTSDGPNGARGATFAGGTRAACFPAAVCSASTWNPSLSRRVGVALAEETQTKGARVLYA